MKKIILFFGSLLFALNCFAQSPRMQLVEEFTSETENKCAQQDPAFNTLILNNTSNVIALKYEMTYPNFGGDIANSFGGQGGQRQMYYNNYLILDAIK